MCVFDETGCCFEVVPPIDSFNGRYVKPWICFIGCKTGRQIAIIKPSANVMWSMACTFAYGLSESTKFLSSSFIPFQRKSLLALEKEDEDERNKTIESLKTALRTQPMRQTILDLILAWLRKIVENNDNSTKKWCWCALVNALLKFLLIFSFNGYRLLRFLS